MSHDSTHSLRSRMRQAKQIYVRMIERVPALNALRSKHADFDQLAAVACLSFLVGTGIGMIAAQSLDPPAHVAGMPGINRPKSWLRSVFAPTIAVSGAQPDRSYVLSDFEQPSDFKLWKVNSSMVEVTNDPALQGEFSGKITFYGASSKLCGVTIEEYFSSRYAVNDWTEYGALSFQVFNPGERASRLIIQIKDRWGTPYKQDIVLQGGEKRRIEIPIFKIGGVIHVQAVDQITLFTWDSGRDEVIILDQLALLPADPSERRMPV